MSTESQALRDALQDMNSQPDVSGDDSERLRELCRITALEVKATGMVSAATSLEMVGYIRELETSRRTASVGVDAAALLDECDRLLVAHHSSTVASGWHGDCPVCANTGEPNIFHRLSAAKRAATSPSDAAGIDKLVCAEICAEMAREAATIAARHASNFRESGDDIDANLKECHEARAAALREAERRIRASCQPESNVTPWETD